MPASGIGVTRSFNTTTGRPTARVDRRAAAGDVQASGERRDTAIAPISLPRQTCSTCGARQPRHRRIDHPRALRRRQRAIDIQVAERAVATDQRALDRSPSSAFSASPSAAGIERRIGTLGRRNRILAVALGGVMPAMIGGQHHRIVDPRRIHPRRKNRPVRGRVSVSGCTFPRPRCPSHGRHSRSPKAPGSADRSAALAHLPRLPQRRAGRQHRAVGLWRGHEAPEIARPIAGKAPRPDRAARRRPRWRCRAPRTRRAVRVPGAAAAIAAAIAAPACVAVGDRAVPR